MAGARKASSEPAKSLEARLWDAADKLRGNLEASECKPVVLGLVVLKYVSDAFTARRLELETALSDPHSDDHIPSEARRERILESRDEYTSHNVFWVPPRARWEQLLDNAKQPGIGQYLDEAMDLIEYENPNLKGALPKNFGRPELDKRLLGELVDMIGTSGFTNVDHGTDEGPTVMLTPGAPACGRCRRSLRSAQERWTGRARGPHPRLLVRAVQA